MPAFRPGYLDPGRFFAGTHPTENLKLLVKDVGERLFVTPYLDVPLLLLAGFASCLAPSRLRAFLLVLLLSQLGLLVLLALYPPEAMQLRSRRFLTVDFYAIALIASFWRDTMMVGTHRRLRNVVLALLVAGNVWQLADLAWFVRNPIPRDPPVTNAVLPISDIESHPCGYRRH